jgi:hypothetical protein
MSSIPIGSWLVREDIHCIYINSKQQAPITSFPNDEAEYISEISG